MCGNCFGIFPCCSCASWNDGLDWSACTRVPMSWQGDSRDSYIDLWHHEWWLDPLQCLGRSPQVVSASARTAASATPVTAQLLFAIRTRHVFFFTCVARHGRNICDTFSDLCQSRYARFGTVLFCLGTLKTTTPHCVTTPGALVNGFCPWRQSGRPASHWLYLINHPYWWLTFVDCAIYAFPLAGSCYVCRSARSCLQLLEVNPGRAWLTCGGQCAVTRDLATYSTAPGDPHWFRPLSVYWIGRSPRSAY